MPFPEHGRQMKVNEAAITDEQVLTRILLSMQASRSMCSACTELSWHAMATYC